ncbi:hypothetical protein ACJRO7_025083 [Eucalyptus globulus]|uniref:Uncharacterized protein n=1 Tax=Eucalyptus globulus TaxID=34317 RepID=A0ABD3KGB6_EUCGL
MASSVARESWASTSKIDDELAGSVSKDILLSLLEESPQGEERDDEQLNDVIRSLEAEINLDMVSGSDLVGELESTGDSFEEHGGRYTGGNSMEPLDFDWIDMEMVPSSPSDDMNWYMDRYEDDEIMNNMVEFGVISDYSQIYCGIPLEEQGYGSLWQDTYDEMMM